MRIIFGPLVMGLAILIMIPIIIIILKSHKKKNIEFIDDINSGDVTDEEILEIADNLMYSYPMSLEEASYIINNTDFTNRVSDIFNIKLVKNISDQQVFYIVTFVDNMAVSMAGQKIGGFKYEEYGKFVFTYKPEAKRFYLGSNFTWKTNEDKFKLQDKGEKFIDYLKTGFVKVNN